MAKSAFFAGCFGLIIGFSTANGQVEQEEQPVTELTTEEAAVDTAADATPAVPTPVNVMLTESKALEGEAFIGTDDETRKSTGSGVKVTLTSAGQVVDATETDESGKFSFENVAPGEYKVTGSNGAYVATQSYDVVPFSPIAAESTCSSCSLGLTAAQPEIVYDSFSTAPVSSFSTAPCSACSGISSGAGFGRGFGGGIGGRLGGGRLLGNGRIGLVGLAGLAGLAGIDASPDQ